MVSENIKNRVDELSKKINEACIDTIKCYLDEGHKISSLGMSMQQIMARGTMAQLELSTSATKMIDAQKNTLEIYDEVFEEFDEMLSEIKESNSNAEDGEYIVDTMKFINSKFHDIDIVGMPVISDCIAQMPESAKAIYDKWANYVFDSEKMIKKKLNELKGNLRSNEKELNKNKNKLETLQEEKKNYETSYQDDCLIVEKDVISKIASTNIDKECIVRNLCAQYMTLLVKEKVICDKSSGKKKLRKDLVPIEEAIANYKASIKTNNSPEYNVSKLQTKLKYLQDGIDNIGFYSCDDFINLLSDCENEHKDNLKNIYEENITKFNNYKDVLINDRKHNKYKTVIKHIEDLVTEFNNEIINMQGFNNVSSIEVDSMAIEHLDKIVAKKKKMNADIESCSLKVDENNKNIESINQEIENVGKQN